MAHSQHIFTWIRQAAREHWLPLLILVAPINWVIYQADKADNIGPMLPLPAVAFVVGLALRPRHVWLVWLGAVLIQWVTMAAWGAYATAAMPGAEETPLSLTIEAFFWMAGGVLLPVWLGRLAGRAIQVSRHPGEHPEGLTW